MQNASVARQEEGCQKVNAVDCSDGCFVSLWVLLQLGGREAYCVLCVGAVSVY
jgi:hypothetical protein